MNKSDALVFIVYKEWLELKSNKHLIFNMAGQSIGYGLIFPVITWLMMSNILPLKMEGLNINDLDAQWDKLLLIYYPSLLPFFIAQMLATFTLPSVSNEIENQTIEHLLVLPISWNLIISGKLLYYLFCGLLFGYTVSITYWIGTFLISDNLSVDYLTSYFFLFIPSIVFYVISIAILISALTKETKGANVYSSVLTWGLFLLIFIITWITELEISNEFLLILSSLFLIVGAFCVYSLIKINTEKLIL